MKPYDLTTLWYYYSRYGVYDISRNLAFMNSHTIHVGISIFMQVRLHEYIICRGALCLYTKSRETQDSYTLISYINQ